MTQVSFSVIYVRVVCILSKLIHYVCNSILFNGVHFSKCTINYRTSVKNGVRQFFDEFELLLQYIKHSNKYNFFPGDFNINLMTTLEQPSTSNFFDIFTSHFHLPVFMKPTRITPSSATTIDNILTNFHLQHCISIKF